MKKILSALIFLYCVPANAQTITTNELPVTFLSGERNSVNTTIYGNSIVPVVTEWENFLKFYKCEQITNEMNEVKGHNVFFKEIINRHIDIYSRFEEDKENKIIKMFTAVDIGAGNYIKSDVNPSEIKVLEKMAREFALKMTKAPIEEYLKAALNHQQKLKNEINDLEKDNIKLFEDVSAGKNKMSKLEKDLSEKKTTLEKKKEEATAELKLTEGYSDPKSEAAKSSAKKYGKLAEQQKDLENDIIDLLNKIKSVGEKIKLAENGIKSNNGFISDKKSEIESQRKIAEELQKKLNKIN
jgi:hypothetical protein